MITSFIIREKALRCWSRVPDTEALQFAYGSVPVVLILLTILIQNVRQGKKHLLLLTDILVRLDAVVKEMRHLDLAGRQQQTAVKLSQL